MKTKKIQPDSTTRMFKWTDRNFIAGIHNMLPYVLTFVSRNTGALKLDGVNFQSNLTKALTNHESTRSMYNELETILTLFR